MNYSQNTGFNSRSPSPPNPNNPAQRNPQTSIYTSRPTPRDDPSAFPSNNNNTDSLYRTYKYPDQMGHDDLGAKKDVLYQLIKDMNTQSGRFVLDPSKKQDYSKRLTQLQKQIDGMMRQSYQYSIKSPGGQRTIDYLSMLTQKQNQVNQLERKITYLQSKLRMKDQRESDLQRQLEQRFKSISIKNDEIERLKNSQKNYKDSSNINNAPNESVNTAIRNLMSTLDNLQRRGNPNPAQLQGQIESWILSLPNESILKRKFRSADENWLEDKYKRYVSYLTTEAASIVNNVNKLYTSQIMNLKSSGSPAEYDPKILQLLGKQAVPMQFFPSQQTIMKTQILTDVNSRPLLSSYSPQRSRYMNNVSKVVQVPVQDTRTKALIHKLASQMKRLYTKYPKLATQISPELSQYLTHQMLDVIEVDQLDRLVQIVRYKPQVVRVENVYNFNTQKNRKVQFHLKVLIKALLDQMERIRVQYRIQPQIDQGVINMIRHQVNDIVDAQQILSIYRSVPKIVQVQKVVQQVVQKIVPVPHYVPVTQTRTDVIPVRSVQVVKDTVNIPLQVHATQPLIHQKLITGNQYNERVIPKTVIQQSGFETVTEVPRVRQVDRVVGLPQQVINTVEVQGPQRIVPLEKTVVRDLIQEKIVPVVQYREKIKEVQKIVQKIVTVIQQVPKIVIVQKIVQKLVPQIQYVESQRVQNYVVQKPVQVICQVQKIVPIQKIIQRVVSYPQIVQKIVQVIVREQILKQIQVIKQVPVYQKQLVVQDRIVQKPTPPLVQQAIKQIDRIIEVPLIHEKVRIQKQFRKQPVIQRQQKLVRQAVHIQVPVFLTQQVVIEVEKPTVQIVKEQYPREIIKQKLIPVQTLREQLVPTPYIVQRIIQKLVEVPKIVEIQKIVQKIVSVPRVVQRIVQVQKIVQKIVQRNIYHTNIQPVEYLNQVPITVEKVIHIQTPQYIYQKKQVPKLVQKPVPVVSQTFRESVRVQQIQQPPRVTIQRRQVPIQLITQKVIPMVIQDHVYFQLKQQIIVPMQMPIPQTLIQQKIVPVQQIVPVLQPVQQIKQKIVEVPVHVPGELIVRDRMVQKLFVQNQVKVVRDQIPYYNQTIKQVQMAVQKIVPVQRVIRQVQQVPVLVQKIVNQISQIPTIVQVQRVVQIPIKQQQLITIDRIVPKIVTLNKAFAQIVDKLHEFPRLAQQMKQVQRRLQQIVPEKHVSTEIQQAQIMVQRAVLQQKLVQVDKYIHVLNQTLKSVDCIIEKPMDPIIIYQQKILQVPVVVQKIAQRITVMPQVVQVLKYIHEVTDNDNLGVATSMDIGSEELQYQRLGKNVNRELNGLRSLLMEIRNMPQFSRKVTVIDNFLVEFNKFLAYPRLRQVINQKIVNNTVQKQKLVRVPVSTLQDQKRNLASAVLIDKLLNELKKIKQSNPNYQFNNLDPQILYIFGDQLQPISSRYDKSSYNQLLDQYTRAIFTKFNNYGNFTPGHQSMLRQYINQRFQLANKLKKLSKQATKYKQLYSSQKQLYDRQRVHNQRIKGKFNQINQQLNNVIVSIIDMGIRKSLQNKLLIIQQLISGYFPASQTPTYKLAQIDEQRIPAIVREKDLKIQQLRKIIQKLKKDIQTGRYQLTQHEIKVVKSNQCPYHVQIINQSQTTIIELQKTIKQLNQQISYLKQQLRNGSGGDQTIISNMRVQINKLNIKISEMQKYISTIQSRPAVADHSKCNADISRLTSQLNKQREQTYRLKQQLTRLRMQLNRLRQIQIVHRKCKDNTTQTGQYGRNYRQYVDLNASKHSSQNGSLNSDSSRGVYRSTGNYGGYNSKEKGGSMNYIAMGNSAGGNYYGGSSNNNQGTIGRYSVDGGNNNTGGNNNSTGRTGGFIETGGNNNNNNNQYNNNNYGSSMPSSPRNSLTPNTNMGNGLSMVGNALNSPSSQSRPMSPAFNTTPNSNSNSSNNVNNNNVGGSSNNINSANNISVSSSSVSRGNSLSANSITNNNNNNNNNGNSNAGNNNNNNNNNGGVGNANYVSESRLSRDSSNSAFRTDLSTQQNNNSNNNSNSNSNSNNQYVGSPRNNNSVRNSSISSNAPNNTDNNTGMVSNSNNNNNIYTNSSNNSNSNSNSNQLAFRKKYSKDSSKKQGEQALSSSSESGGSSRLYGDTNSRKI